MTFTSHAQNFEDVVLWRALKHVKNGFYTDVGAERPERDSVTKAFYDMGWCGINIEPNPIHFASLEELRTRDTNLPRAVCDSDGSLTLNCVEDTCLSTLNDAIADQHRQITQQKVAVTTLRESWRIAAPLRKLSLAIRPRVDCNVRRNHSGDEILPAKAPKTGKPACRR